MQLPELLVHDNTGAAFCRPSAKHCLQQPSGEGEEYFTLSQPPSVDAQPVPADDISAIPCQPVAADTQATTSVPATHNETRNANWNIEIEAWLADLKTKRLPNLLIALNDVRSIYTSLNHLILTHRLKELQKQQCGDLLRCYIDGQAGQLLEVDACIVEEATAVVADIWKASSYVFAAGQPQGVPVFGQVPILVGKASPSPCCNCSRSTSVGASSSLDRSGGGAAHEVPSVASPHQVPVIVARDIPEARDETAEVEGGTVEDADVSMESNGIERQQSVFVDAGSPTVEIIEGPGGGLGIEQEAETAYRIHPRTNTRRSCRLPVTRSQTAQKGKRKRRLSDGATRVNTSPSGARECKRVRRGSTPIQRPATAPAAEPAKCVDREECKSASVDVIDCEQASPSPPVDETSRIFCSHHGDVTRTDNYQKGVPHRFICSLCDEETDSLRTTAQERSWPIQDLTYSNTTKKWTATFTCKNGHRFTLDNTTVRKQPWCPSCYEATHNNAKKTPTVSAAKNAQAAWTQAHQRILFATARENLRRTKYADDFNAHPWLHPAHKFATSPDSHRSTKSTKKTIYSKAFTDADEDASATIERLIAVGSGSSPWTVLCIVPPAGGIRKRLKSKDPLYLEARLRYKQWVKRVHPDKNGHRYAKEAFHILDSAWKQIESQVIR